MTKTETHYTYNVYARVFKEPTDLVSIIIVGLSLKDYIYIRTERSDHNGNLIKILRSKVLLERG